MITSFKGVYFFAAVCLAKAVACKLILQLVTIHKIINHIHYNYFSKILIFGWTEGTVNNCSWNSDSLQFNKILNANISIIQLKIKHGSNLLKEWGENL